MRLVFISLFFIGTILNGVESFSGGAGSCIGGQPAVDGGNNHMGDTTTVLNFDSSGYTIDVDTDTTTITVAGPEFKGILIRVSGLDANDTPVDNGFAMIPTTGFEEAMACNSESAAVEGVTHSNSNPKTSVSTQLESLSSGIVKLDIQVTIVVENSSTVSTHTYKAVEASLPVPSPVDAPVAAPVATMPTPSGGGDDDPISCFSASNTVDVKGQGETAMDRLNIGDYVRSSNGYSRVYGFAHYDQKFVSDFLQIHVQGTNKPLEISKEHIMYANGRVVRAEDVVVGDLVGPDAQPATSIRFVTRKGVFAPLTESGELVVSGVLASSYVALLDLPLGLQNSATHMALTPLRMVCTTIDFDLCAKEDYSGGISSNISWMVMAARRVSSWPWMMQLVTLLMVFPLLFVTWMIETNTEFFAVLVVIAGFAWSSRRPAKTKTL